RVFEFFLDERVLCGRIAERLPPEGSADGLGCNAQAVDRIIDAPSALREGNSIVSPQIEIQAKDIVAIRQYDSVARSIRRTGDEQEHLRTLVGVGVRNRAAT